MGKSKLRIEEREKILYYRSQNRSYREIGKLLNRSHTTISRELKANVIEGEYSPSRAENRVKRRYLKCGRKRKIEQNIELFDIHLTAARENAGRPVASKVNGNFL